MSKPAQLPTSLPGGLMLPHLSARMRTQIIDTVFEMNGGVERFHAWTEKSDENYGEFLKMWAKGASKAVSTEHSVSDGVEALLEKLDEQERFANAVDITPREAAE